MKIPELEIRCSSLHKIMSEPKSKSEIVSDTTKSYLYQLMKQERFGYVKELDNKEINKGNALEELAITNSGLVRGKAYQKCSLPRQYVQIESEYCQVSLSGECDILDGDMIVDTKCSWSIDSFPICQAEALQRAGKQGYIWQMHGYMRLYNAKCATIDFWLLPTPEHFFSDWQRENDPELIYQHTGLIDSVPWYQRVTSLAVAYSDDAQNKIDQRIQAAAKYWAYLHGAFQAA